MIMAAPNIQHTRSINEHARRHESRRSGRIEINSKQASREGRALNMVMVAPLAFGAIMVVVDALFEFHHMVMGLWDGARATCELQ